MNINWKDIRQMRIQWLKEFEREIINQDYYQKFDIYYNGTNAFLRITWNVEKPKILKIGKWRSIIEKLNLNYNGDRCWSSYVNKRYYKLKKQFEKEMDKVQELQVG